MEIQEGTDWESHFISTFSQNAGQESAVGRADGATGQRQVIILAGGEGERMRETIIAWLGYHLPKQYCSFIGTRSMLQHTIDRARALVPSDCISIVIGPNHRDFLKINRRPLIPGRILEQPGQKDTAPGLLFPLTYVMTENPDSTVIIFPSDQYIFPEEPFLESVDRAATLTQHFEDYLVLLAAVPDQCETDYGWIRTSSNSPSIHGFQDFRRIDSFVEKPSSKMARECYLSGCFWNTMVMAVKARRLWQMGWQKLPGTMTGFEMLRRVLLAVRDGRADPEMVDICTRHLYRNLVPVNFSRYILERSPQHLLVLPLPEVSWSDWGRPSRIVQSLAQSGKVPRFLLESSRGARIG